MLTLDWISLNQSRQWYFSLWCFQIISNFRTEQQNRTAFSQKFCIPALQTGTLRHRRIKLFAQADTANHSCYLLNKATEQFHSRTRKTALEKWIKKEEQIFTHLCTTFKHLLKYHSAYQLALTFAPPTLANNYFGLHRFCFWSLMFDLQVCPVNQPTHSELRYSA